MSVCGLYSPWAGTVFSGVKLKDLLKVIETDHILIQTLELNAALEVRQLHQGRGL